MSLENLLTFETGFGHWHGSALAVGFILRGYSDGRELSDLRLFAFGAGTSNHTRLWHIAIYAARLTSTELLLLHSTYHVVKKVICAERDSFDLRQCLSNWHF